MKKSILQLCMTITLSLVISSAWAGGVTLKYGFAPGQQWECTRMSQTQFTMMGKKQVQRQKKTLLYTVSKGEKKGWVHLTAKYINPPKKTEENQFALGYYDLVFSADIHTSGDTRNIKVDGVEKPMNDETIPPTMKMSMVQNNKILAQSLKPAVFWFPELPEEALQPGDEFEEKRTVGVDDPNMTSKTKSRTIFSLDDVTKGLAYFSTKQRHNTEMKTMGGGVDFGASGKGETIFDLKTGMWIEYITRSKMKFSGAGMMGQNVDDMIVTEKVEMQLR